MNDNVIDATERFQAKRIIAAWERQYYTDIADRFTAEQFEPLCEELTSDKDSDD